MLARLDRIAGVMTLSTAAALAPIPASARAPVQATAVETTTKVADHGLTVDGLDFGDAPDPTYPTLLASNGARHVVGAGANPTLGALVDTEPNGQPNAGLTGDDLAGDDEDGVSFPAVLVPGTDGELQLSTGATGGAVSCWIDFDRDGDWSDAGEQIAIDVSLGPGETAIASFAVPVGSPQGSAPVRCRISTQTGLGVSGQAPDGEVEDHIAPVGVEDPVIGVAKLLVGTTPLGGAVYRVRFEIRIDNLGNVPLSSVHVEENLATTFADAASFSVTSLSSSDLTVNPGFDGAGDVALLAPGQSLGVGETATILLEVQVDTGGDLGPYLNQVSASGTSPASVSVTDLSQDGSEPDPDLDGDPTNNEVPTEIAFVAASEIPTLGTWALLGLIAALALVGWRRTSAS